MASAGASSTLLSGYGGPGQGSQAIIGSTLLGAGGSGGGGGSTNASSGAGASVPASIALPRAPVHHSSPSAGRRHHATRTAAPKTSAKPTAGRAAPATLVPAAARSGAGGTLGLTGADVVYIILGFCLLAATALLTVRLTGRAGGAGRTR